MKNNETGISGIVTNYDLKASNPRRPQTWVLFNNMNDIQLYSWVTQHGF